MQRWVMAAWLTIAAGHVFAQEPVSPPPPPPVQVPDVPPAGNGSGGEIKFDLPPDMPSGTTPHRVTVPGAWDRNRDSKDASVLKGARVLSSANGEARIQLAAGGERVLRPGDVVGTDTVKSVDSKRVVLERGASAETGEALVVLSVDAQGRTRLRVYLTKDPNPSPVPNSMSN